MYIAIKAPGRAASPPLKMNNKGNDIVLTVKKDVAVIGSGPAGTSAAYVAAENGLDVIIIEKSLKTGGMSGGGNGLFAIGTKEQQSMNLGLSLEDCYRRFMETGHYTADGRIVRELFARSAETIEWLKARGAEFEKIPSAYYPGAPFTWHKRVDDGPPPPKPGGDEGGEPPGMPPMGMLHLVYATLTARFPNVQIMTETTAKKLVKSDDGRISGVICAGKDGQDIMIEAPAVMIATGGFGNSPQMVRNYTGYPVGEGVFSFGAPTAVGEGLQMAWEAGADTDNILIETIACMEPPCSGPGGVPMNGGVLRQPTMLFVNLEGERFMSEECMRHFGYAGNAVYRQREHCAFAIMDADTNEYYENNAWDWQLTGEYNKSDDFLGFVQKMIDKGYGHFFVADSLDELAEKTGIGKDNLKKTVGDYNRYCETGRDELFFKSAKYLRPVKTPKYIAARFQIGAYGTMGGIRINYRAEVLDKAGSPIPGLYAGGFDANSIFGDTFPFEFAGIGSTFSFVYGRIAGESLSEFCKNR